MPTPRTIQIARNQHDRHTNTEADGGRAQRPSCRHRSLARSCARRTAADETRARENNRRCRRSPRRRLANIPLSERCSTPAHRRIGRWRARPPHEARSAHAARIEASWRERALNEDGLKAAHHEILTQRSTIGELVGKIRDLEADLPEDGVQRLITENTTLKHRIRELTQEVKRFQERLQAARGNNRFLDNKIADLEARLVNPTNVFEPSPGSPATADRYSATTAAASTPSRSSNWPPRAPATHSSRHEP